MRWVRRTLASTRDPDVLEHFARELKEDGGALPQEGGGEPGWSPMATGAAQA